MKTTILLLAMTVSFAAQSQTLDNPVVLKSFDKDKDKAIWYTSKKSEDINETSKSSKNTNSCVSQNKEDFFCFEFDDFIKII